VSGFKNAAKLLSLRIRPWGLVTTAGVILSIATFLGMFGRLWWLLDLFSHFRVQYFAGLLVVALFLLFRRRYKVAAFFGVFAVANLYIIAPLYFGTVPEPTGASRSYRSLLINVNTESGVPSKVAQVIQKTDPDVLVLEEVNDQWLSALSAALAAYPYFKALPRDDNFGIALYSKHPLVRGEIRQVGEAEVPSAIAEIRLPDGEITVMATHPLPPAGRENSRLRNEQLARLPEIVKQATSPVLLVGDLNVTPWSYYLKRLLNQSGLRDSSQGKGVLGTWPTRLPILLIPIDHCLHTAGVHVTKRAWGPKVGSDHYPVVVDFVLSSSSMSPRQTAPTNAAPAHR
jgi:endonuclease/exonuclease/phosphatase (EEP) superfamily protein YafD